MTNPGTFGAGGETDKIKYKCSKLQSNRDIINNMAVLLIISHWHYRQVAIKPKVAANSLDSKGQSSCYLRKINRVNCISQISPPKSIQETYFGTRYFKRNSSLNQLLHSRQLLIKDDTTSSWKQNPCCAEHPHTCWVLWVSLPANKVEWAWKKLTICCHNVGKCSCKLCWNVYAPTFPFYKIFKAARTKQPAIQFTSINWGRRQGSTQGAIFGCNSILDEMEHSKF